MLLWLAITPNIANARVVEIKLADGLVITADYQAADHSKPTIILLHPFLQTRLFPTIRTLANHLASNGFGVLTPTLSLGISYRRQNLACEAAHTQPFNQHTHEIKAWIKWLQQHNVRNIIGAGHGMGAIAMLATASSHGKPSPFSSLILVTLPYISPQGGVRINASQLQKARAEKEKGLADFLGNYILAFCNRFIAPRDVYLSLSKWNQEEVLSHLAKLEIPAYVIIGSDDTVLNAQSWPDKIVTTGAKLIYIDGAGHFFTGEQALSLYQAIVSILETSHQVETTDAL